MSNISLVERLKFWRAERPDEWQMDEFIWDAKKLEQERNELAAQVGRLLCAANNYLYYSDDVSSPSLYSAAKDNLETVLSETPPVALASLKARWNCPTVEHGKNRYGLDVAYFRDLFNRELNRTLQDYRPHELARNLLRMAKAADESVIAEAEFSGELKVQWQAEAITEFVNTVVLEDEKTVSDANYMWDVGDVKDFSVEYIQRLQEAGDE